MSCTFAAFRRLPMTATTRLHLVNLDAHIGHCSGDADNRANFCGVQRRVDPDSYRPQHLEQRRSNADGRSISGCGGNRRPNLCDRRDKRYWYCGGHPNLQSVHEYLENWRAHPNSALRWNRCGGGECLVLYRRLRKPDWLCEHSVGVLSQDKEVVREVSDANCKG